MVLEEFRAEAIKLAGKFAPREVALADRLLRKSLVPLEGCFHVHDRSIVDPALVTPDQAGIVLVINQLFEKQPERFGDADNRKKIADDVRAIIAAKHKKSVFLGKLAEVLKTHAPHALSDISITLVGMDDPAYLTRYLKPEWAVFSEDAAPLMAMFATIHDFNPARNTPAFSLHKVVNDYPDTKVDFVVVGNVDNDPDTRYWNLILPAAARMLKTGGSSIVLSGYSSDSYDNYIRNNYMQMLCGQTRTAGLTLPPYTNVHPFVVFDQTVPCQVTMADFDHLQNIRVTGEYKDPDMGNMIGIAIDPVRITSEARMELLTRRTFDRVFGNEFRAHAASVLDDDLMDEIGPDPDPNFPRHQKRKPIDLSNLTQDDFKFEHLKHPSAGLAPQQLSDQALLCEFHRVSMLEAAERDPDAKRTNGYPCLLTRASSPALFEEIMIRQPHSGPQGDLVGSLQYQATGYAYQFLFKGFITDALKGTVIIQEITAALPDGGMNSFYKTRAIENVERMRGLVAQPPYFGCVSGAYAYIEGAADNAKWQCKEGSAERQKLDAAKGYLKHWSDLEQAISDKRAPYNLRMRHYLADPAGAVRQATHTHVISFLENDKAGKEILFDGDTTDALFAEKATAAPIVLKGRRKGALARTRPTAENAIRAEV